MKSTT